MAWVRLGKGGEGVGEVVAVSCLCHCMSDFGKCMFFLFFPRSTFAKEQRGEKEDVSSDDFLFESLSVP